MAEREVVGKLAERLGGTNASQRAAVAVSQLIGVIFMRYVLKFEPLASMPADELTARTTVPLRAALADRGQVKHRTAQPATRIPRW